MVRVPAGACPPRRSGRKRRGGRTGGSIRGVDGRRAGATQRRRASATRRRWASSHRRRIVPMDARIAPATSGSGRPANMSRAVASACCVGAPLAMEPGSSCAPTVSGAAQRPSGGAGTSSGAGAVQTCGSCLSGARVFGWWRRPPPQSYHTLTVHTEMAESRSSVHVTKREPYP